MAGKPVVTLEFAGDEKKLTNAMEKVGQASKTMSTDVGNSSKTMSDSGKNIDDLADKAGTGEQRFQGFSDVIAGTGDVMTGFNEGSITGMAMGFADIAGGLEGFLIPMFGRLVAWLAATTIGQWALTAAQTAWNAVTRAGAAAMAVLNAVMRANPILFIVGLLATLVGAFILLWNKSAGFRGFFQGMWKGIQNVVGGVVNWIKGAWTGVVEFFRGVPGRIGRVLASIGGFFKSAFTGAANLAIDAVNWMIDRINDLITGVNHINPFEDVPHIDKLKRMHGGGVVPGMPGTERLAILQAGETVTPSGGGGGGKLTLVVSSGADSRMAEMINWMIRMKMITPVWEG